LVNKKDTKDIRVTYSLREHAELFDHKKKMGLSFAGFFLKLSRDARKCAGMKERD